MDRTELRMCLIYLMSVIKLYRISLLHAMRLLQPEKTLKKKSLPILKVCPVHDRRRLINGAVQRSFMLR